MLFYTNKSLENQIKKLEQLVLENNSLLETIKAHHNNGHVLLLEDMTEVLVQKLMSLAQDDKTIVLFSKDGHRIEIKEKDDSLKKKKNLF